MRRPRSALSDDEAKAIIEACLEGHGRKGASEATITRCLRWANAVRSEAALLELVLEGKLVIKNTKENGFVTDELTFGPRL